MASNPKSTRTQADRNTPVVSNADRAKAAQQAAEVCLAPEYVAAAAVMAYTPGIQLQISETASVLRTHCTALAEQDMRHAEDMLLNQAHALQAMFYDLARTAKGQSNLTQIQALTTLALKAQSQCRATLQTLSDVKHPNQPTFIKQANIANGPQQVNNGCSTGVAAKPRTREEKPIRSNELLEDSHETEIIGMDTGAARSASGNDPHLEAVGALNGAKHR
jgi:hypothetical protein